MADIAEKLREALSQKTCMKHPVGVVIETEDYQYVLGWNGAPSKGANHDACSRKGYKSGEGMHLCPTVHAERRAISIAARDGIKLMNSTIYMNANGSRAQTAQNQ